MVEAVVSPTLSDDDARDEMLAPDAATTIVEYLSRYEYATREHVVMLLIWRGLLRRGATRAIDLDDIDDTDTPAVNVEHRPETGTPLKNKTDGNRYVSFKPETRDVIQGYIDNTRDDVEDEHGREPLLTTVHGRPHRTTIQADVYSVTRPCYVGAECPHDRDPAECDAAANRQVAYECPSSVGPHAVRRGAITNWLRSDVPVPAISSRANSDPAVIETHYDRRTEREKAEQRREYLGRVE